MRWITLAVGVVVLVFGMLCLNYTEAEGLDRHRARAAELNLPPPGIGIWRLGVLLTPIGGGLIGFAIGNRRPRPDRYNVTRV
jgi:hypothetical protein